MNTKTLQFPDSLYTRRDPVVSRIKRKVAKGRKPFFHIVLGTNKKEPSFTHICEECCEFLGGDFSEHCIGCYGEVKRGAFKGRKQITIEQAIAL